MKRSTCMIKRLQHLGISHFFHIPFHALEFIFRKFLSYSCLHMCQIIMPPLRVARGRPPRRNVEEEEVPNALNVQPQGEFTNVEFYEAIGMLSKIVKRLVGKYSKLDKKKITTRGFVNFRE